MRQSILMISASLFLCVACDLSVRWKECDAAASSACDAGVFAAATENETEVSTSEETSADTGSQTSVDSGTEIESRGTETETNQNLPLTLPVFSAGENIGFVVGVNRHYITVFDPQNRILFNLDDHNGYVLPAETYYSDSEHCESPQYAPSYVYQYCGENPPERPFEMGERRRWVYSNYKSPELEGAPTAVYVETGDSIHIEHGYMWQLSIQQCNSFSPLCAYRIEQTNVIPPVFDLPITFTK